MIAVRYKGLKEEIEKMGETKLCPAPRKTPRVDNSEEEVIPPTPRKVKQTSVATSHQQVQATATDMAKDFLAPGTSTSEAVESAPLSKPVSDKDESDGDDAEYLMAADYF